MISFFVRTTKHIIFVQEVTSAVSLVYCFADEKFKCKPISVLLTTHRHGDYFIIIIIIICAVLSTFHSECKFAAAKQHKFN